MGASALFAISLLGFFVLDVKGKHSHEIDPIF
jgi:hypothetical protein